MISEEVKKQIIAELGIEEVDVIKQEEIMQKLEDNIQRKIVLEVLDLLGQEDRERILQFTEAGENEKAFEFLSEKIPAMEPLVKAAAVSVVKEFKNSIK